MDEVEAKIALTREESGALEAKLSELCGEPAETHEINRICDILGFFKRTGRLLRLREEHEGSETRYIMTYKGKKKRSRYNRRREIERYVGRHIVRMMDALATGLTYVKERKTYRLHDSKVSLDNVLRLGRFIEIESPDEKEIGKIKRELGIKRDPLKDSYPELMERLSRKEYSPI